jgi:geranylgeranyl pyrophosphate synthase
LTWPVLLAWERANATDRARLENLVREWQPENFSAVNELLIKYETFEPSREIISHYLDQARRTLRVLPESNGHTGLLRLADFLAQQTDVLAVCVR